MSVLTGCARFPSAANASATPAQTIYGEIMLNSQGVISPSSYYFFALGVDQTSNSGPVPVTGGTEYTNGWGTMNNLPAGTVQQPPLFVEFNNGSFAEYVQSGTFQVNTATLAVTSVGAGTVQVTITAAGLPGSPKAYPITITNNETATAVASQIVSALLADSTLCAQWTPSLSGANIVLTQVNCSGNDATLNIAITPVTATGITPVVTSSPTVTGVSGSNGTTWKYLGAPYNCGTRFDGTNWHIYVEVDQSALTKYGLIPTGIANPIVQANWITVASLTVPPQQSGLTKPYDGFGVSGNSYLTPIPLNVSQTWISGEGGVPAQPSDNEAITGSTTDGLYDPGYYLDIVWWTVSVRIYSQSTAAAS
jgi:hypothetical protein